LLAAILREFDASLDAFADPANVAARWAHRAHLPGTRYRYRRDSDGIERDGIAVRIGPQGALIVRGEHGEESIEMADVRIVGRG
jgi:biotin-(acetyl-CoA carboxylase) ligase